ncbi:MAG: hypothetical protein AB8W78_11925 [Arsenophonus endosymbiont of Dermacentor nuttalli]
MFNSAQDIDIDIDIDIDTHLFFERNIELWIIGVFFLHSNSV